MSAKSGLEQAAEITDQIATAGEALGTRIGGVGGVVVTVLSIAGSIAAAFMRLANPVVKITRMRDAIKEKLKVDAEVDALLDAEGVPK